MYEDSCRPPEESSLPGEDRAFPWSLLDTYGDAVILLGSEGEILCANSTAAGWLGLGESALAGRCVWDLYPPARAGHYRIVVNRALATGQPIRFVDRKDDRWYELLIQPLPRARVALYARDITRQIEAEERLKHTNLQLVTAEEDERRRIAQDLHDDIGQRVTALLLSLKATHSALMAGDREAGNQLREAIRMVEGVIKRVRQILHQLRPPLLAATALPNVLASLCASLAQAEGPRIDFSSDEDFPAIPEAEAMALYRFVQEGLNNAVKYARANCIWVNLDCENGEVSASIEDDGQGFDPAQGDALNLGLQGIRDRFLMLEGTFTIDSAPGKGTRLYGSLPLRGYS